MGKNLRIVFIGTSDFAVASLKKLVEDQMNIVVVITSLDKPKGRGKKLAISAVKSYALEMGLPILQPSNLKSKDFLEKLRGYHADLQIVVAFRIMPESVWNMPPLGTFNLHASILPQYRGPAPVNWAIINGEQETGVTTFFLQHKVDTGAIIFQETEPIHDDDDAGSLYRRLMNKGAELVLKTTKAIATGHCPQNPQKVIDVNEKLRYAPKIFKEDGKINWHLSSNEVKNFVKGFSPYPGAWTTFEGKTMKIFDVKKSESDITDPIGCFKTDGKHFLKVKVEDSTLDITDLQIEGKKRMRTPEFLRGYRPTQ